MKERTTFTAQDVEFIREHAPSRSDAEIAGLLGWPKWKAQYVRQVSKIEAFRPEGFWTQARVADLRRMVVAEGLPSSIISERLGCHSSTVRKATAKLGLEKDQAKAAIMRSQNAREAGLKGSASRWEGHEAGPRRALNTHQAPVNFVAQRPVGALPDRIYGELARRPLSASSLASVLGEKEMAVSVQLAAMAAAGEVQAEAVGEGGLRHRAWRLAT